MANLLGNGNEIQTKGYYPPQTYVTSFKQESTNPNLSFGESKSFAKEYLLSQVSVSPDSVVIGDDSYCSGDFCHVYFRHVIGDMLVDNHQASITTHKGKLVSMSYNFDKDPVVNECSGRQLNSADLIAKAERELQAKHDQKDIEYIYYDTGNGLVSAHKFQMNKNQHLIGVVVEDCKGEIVQIVNLTLS